MRPTAAPAAFRVVSTHAETADTQTLVLECESGEPLEFEPGQFTMLYAFGVGEAPISVSGDPADGERLVHTVRAVGAVSRAICAAGTDQQLGVRGPFGRAWPRPEEGADVVFVAGGLGLAPLRPAIYAALAERERYGRVVVLYGGREPEQLLYRDQLAEWEARDDLELGVTVDAAGPSWRGAVGVVPRLLERAELDPQRSVVLACGPEVMMRFSVDAALAAGVPAGRLLRLARAQHALRGRATAGTASSRAPSSAATGPCSRWEQIAAALSVRER